MRARTQKFTPLGTTESNPVDNRQVEAYSGRSRQWDTVDLPSLLPSPGAVIAGDHYVTQGKTLVPWDSKLRENDLCDCTPVLTKISAGVMEVDIGPAEKQRKRRLHDYVQGTSVRRRMAIHSRLSIIVCGTLLLIIA